jgi:hypothetical protein
MINAMLAQSGWIIQNKDEINFSAGLGVAVRECKTPGHGPGRCSLSTVLKL